MDLQNLCKDGLWKGTRDSMHYINWLKRTVWVEPEKLEELEHVKKQKSKQESDDIEEEVVYPAHDFEDVVLGRVAQVNSNRVE